MTWRRGEGPGLWPGGVPGLGMSPSLPTLRLLTLTPSGSGLGVVGRDEFGWLSAVLGRAFDGPGHWEEQSRSLLKELHDSIVLPQLEFRSSSSESLRRNFGPFGGSSGAWERELDGGSDELFSLTRVSEDVSKKKVRPRSADGLVSEPLRILCQVIDEESRGEYGLVRGGRWDVVGYGSRGSCFALGRRLVGM